MWYIYAGIKVIDVGKCEIASSLKSCKAHFYCHLSLFASNHLIIKKEKVTIAGDNKVTIKNRSFLLSLYHH